MKLLAAIFLFVFSLSANAQDTLRNKRGVAILPEAGDFCLQVDAVPFLNYFGNFFNKDTNSAPSTAFINGYPLAISAKYFKDDKTAYRVKARLGLQNISASSFVIQDGQITPDPSIQSEDKIKTSNANIILAGGIEKRRGKTRLQGLYGGEAQLILMTSRTSYSYGNAINETNVAPTRSNFGNNATSAGNWVTESKDGTTTGIGVRAFAGAEYFFLPKLSVGFEFGWSLGFLSQGRGEIITESWDPVNLTVTYTRQQTGGAKSVFLDTDISNGAINLSFYF